MLTARRIQIEFEFLIAVSMKTAMKFALMMEAASTFLTSVKFYQTARRYNLEDSHLWNFKNTG
jgi:hypothetical protein